MFYDLLSLLSSTTSVELRVAIMHLINQIIDMYTQLEPRISMRLQFSSYNIEDIILSIYDKGSTQLKQEIDTFTNSNMEDTKNYSKLHESLVSEKMAEGSDPAEIIEAFSSRWSSSSVSIRKIISFTLCDLLHIPADETYGLSQWLFFNKFVSQLVSKNKSAFLYDSEVHFDKILSQIETGEVRLRKQLEEQENFIEKQNIRIKILEDSNSSLQKKLEDSLQSQELTLRQYSELEKQNLHLEHRYSTITDQLTESLQNLKKESENTQHHQKLAEDNMRLFNEYKHRLQESEKKLEQLDRSSPIKVPPVAILQTKQSQTKSDNVLPDLSTSGSHILKGYSTSSPGNFNKPQLPNSVGQYTQYSPNRRSANYVHSLPDWKKRQLEFDQAQAEKVSQEQHKKIELMKNLPNTEREIEPEAKEISKKEMAFPEPKEDESDEKELQRLEKFLNRHSRLIPEKNNK